jgi:hypothetical protein
MNEYEIGPMLVIKITVLSSKEFVVRPGLPPQRIEEL